jgi:hypothetical protein
MIRDRARGAIPRCPLYVESCLSRVPFGKAGIRPKAKSPARTTLAHCRPFADLPDQPGTGGEHQKAGVGAQATGCRGRPPFGSIVLKTHNRRRRRVFVICRMMPGERAMTEMRDWLRDN